MAKVCRSEPSSSEVQNESAIYHEVCVLTSLDGRPPRELSHHRFNQHGHLTHLSHLHSPRCSDSNGRHGMGTSFMQQLNLTKKDLLPVKLRIRAANGGKFKILGAFLTNPCTNSSTGEMVYVSPDVLKFYINRETLEELEMSVRTFPALNASMTTDTEDVVTSSQCI